MKNYITTIKSILDDRMILWLTSPLIVFFMADYYIWSRRLRYEDIYVFSINGVYPIRFLGIIVLINLLLAFFSYDKEKEISYLLIGASVFVSVLIFVLEVFYLINLNYG